MIAVATLISQLLILAIGIYYLCFKNDIFSFSIHKVSFKMTIISQNNGAKNTKRALYAFKVLLIINISIGIIGYILSTTFLSSILSLFAKDNIEFANLISNIYHYDAIGLVPLGIYYSIMAFLYGFGYTKLSLFINLVRLFVFRIPTLWFLQHFASLG